MMTLRDALRYIVITIVVTVPFLFSPQPAPGHHFCGTFYHIGRYAGLVINCDSYEFARVSVQPAHLLEPKSIRQGRPVFVLAGTVLGYLLYPILSLFHFNIYEAHFAGFLLINLLIVLISLFLLDSILVRFTSLSIVERALMSILMISNTVTKTFFWTAHQQMFVYLTPLLCIHILLWLSRSRPGNRKMYAAAVAIGLGLLVYGNFVLIAISFFSTLLFCRYELRKIVFSTILIVAPTCIWILLLKSLGVSYYNHEMEGYRQFIWIADAWQVSWSALAHQMENYGWAYMHSFHSILILAWAALLVFSLYYIWPATSASLPVTLLWSCCYVIFWELVFMYLMGFYEDRLTYILAAPLLTIFAIFYDRGAKRKWSSVYLLLLVVSLCWHWYNVTRYGPFT